MRILPPHSVSSPAIKALAAAEARGLQWHLQLLDVVQVADGAAEEGTVGKAVVFVRGGGGAQLRVRQHEHGDGGGIGGGCFVEAEGE